MIREIMHDTDGGAVYEDTATGERWNAGDDHECGRRVTIITHPDPAGQVCIAPNEYGIPVIRSRGGRRVHTIGSLKVLTFLRGGLYAHQLLKMRFSYGGDGVGAPALIILPHLTEPVRR